MKVCGMLWTSWTLPATEIQLLFIKSQSTSEVNQLHNFWTCLVRIGQKHNLSPCGPNMWEVYGDFPTYFTPLPAGSSASIGIPIRIQASNCKRIPSKRCSTFTAQRSKSSWYRPENVGPAVCVRIPPEALWRKHGWVDFLFGHLKWKVWKRLFCHLCHLIRLNIVLFNAFFVNNLTSCLTCIEGKNLVVKPLQHNEGMPLRVSNYTTN